MSFEGTFLNGRVEPDSPPDIPEGARIRFEVASEESVETKQQSLSPLAKRLLALAGKATGLPSDMAINHDHYIHGTRKR